jgi:hypothetical protein
MVALSVSIRVALGIFCPLCFCIIVWFGPRQHKSYLFCIVKLLICSDFIQMPNNIDQNSSFQFFRKNFMFVKSYLDLEEINVQHWSFDFKSQNYSHVHPSWKASVCILYVSSIIIDYFKDLFLFRHSYKHITTMQHKLKSYLMKSIYYLFCFCFIAFYAYTEEPYHSYKNTLFKLCSLQDHLQNISYWTTTIEIFMNRIPISCIGLFEIHHVQNVFVSNYYC